MTPDQSPQNQIVWIASYPKSGNTWLRFMLYAALYGQPQRSADVPYRIPDIHRKMPFKKPDSGPTHIKTHFQLTDQHPQLNDTLKAIHIIRNPRDILLSALNYRNLAPKKSFSITDTKKKYAKEFIKIGGGPGWFNGGFGSWASHSRSWTTTTKFPVLQLRYESIRQSPHEGLTQILDFLEITRTQDQIDQAVKNSSFEFMRALEIREKKTDKSNDLTKRLFIGTNEATRKGHYFVNTGKSNQSLESIAPGFDALFNESLKEELQEFGYANNESTHHTS